MPSLASAEKSQIFPRLAQNLSHRFCRLRRRSLPLNKSFLPAQDSLADFEQGGNNHGTENGYH